MSSTAEYTGKRQKLVHSIASQTPRKAATSSNRFLSHPVHPVAALQEFFVQVRNKARNYLPIEQRNRPVSHQFCEVEARFGILKVLYSVPDRRVTSTGVKSINGKHVGAFNCSRHKCSLLAGVTRSAFFRLTNEGISDASSISRALGVDNKDTKHKLRKELKETELVETVYTGYSNDGRVCFQGKHPTQKPVTGKMESKKKLETLDLTIPAANFDLRVTLSSEKTMDSTVQHPPPGWKSKRVKFRRSYRCCNYSGFKASSAWQIDITEVVTTSGSSSDTIDYEIEMELIPEALLELINERDEQKLRKMTLALADQLWRVVLHLNPPKETRNVEDALREHPDKKAVQTAIAICDSLRQYMKSGRYCCPVGKNAAPLPLRTEDVKFIGCMPVNFSRQDLENIRRKDEAAYYLSEKTDGVRYLMVFTGGSVVLLDRKMRGKQPIPFSDNEPFAHILSLVKPGTVLDGEVVMNFRKGRKPRPIFIVFDVLAVSETQPVLRLPFQQRLEHLEQATFRTATDSIDMFEAQFVTDLSIPLPLVRKNFVKRKELDDILLHVVEEHGMRYFRKGELHSHLTDGIIFHPNRPYVFGTDKNLLKWKYLDTVTIDVEMLPLEQNDNDEKLSVACRGDKKTDVNMTRHLRLPKCERARLEADRFESGCSVVEVGFDPECGEWYYHCLRGDKGGPNHIGTVIGAIMELAEGITKDELRLRLLGASRGMRDTYHKNKLSMTKQFVAHQEQKLLEHSQS